MENSQLGESWYWEKKDSTEYATEYDVDVRWILRSINNEKSYGSLRIVSHPDLKPGHLRSHIITIKSSEDKSEQEILQTVMDNFISMEELEVYSVDKHLELNEDVVVAPKRDLEELYGVKVFS